jgi:hypothetical protein
MTNGWQILLPMKEDVDMSNFDNLVAKVQEQGSVEKSVEALLAVIVERMRKVEPTQAGIEKYAGKIERNSQRIVAAVASNQAAGKRRAV